MDNESNLIIDTFPEIKLNQPIKKRTTKAEIFLFVFSLIGFYLYFKSLEGCHNTQTYCLVNLNLEFINRVFTYLLLSCFIFSFIFFMFFLKKVRLRLILFNAFAYFLLFLYDNGADLAYHGSYNRFLFFIFTIVFTVSFALVYYLLFYLLIKKRAFIRILLLFIFVILLVYLFIGRLKGSCEQWSIGLNNEKIINTGEFSSCKIKSPKYCWLYVLDGIMNVSWWLGEDCHYFRKGEREEFLKYIDFPNKEEVYKFAYPDVQDWIWNPDSYFKTLQLSTLKRLTRYDENNKEIIDEYSVRSELKPEIYLTFDKETMLGKVDIKINRKEHIVKQRNDIFSKTKENYAKMKDYLSDDDIKLPPINRKDILVIYVDAISRAHFFRKMPKTANFIEHFYHGKINNEDDISHQSYQFMKYIQFRPITPFGVNPMFYGQSYLDFKGKSLTDNLKELGYITGKANNICSREMYDLEIDDKRLNNIKFYDFDHDMVSFFCDPNFSNPEHPYRINIGPYSMKRRCLYGKDTYEYVIEYADKFWKEYQNESKFFLMAFLDAHEGSLEVEGYLDKRLSEYLWSSYKDGLLSNTYVMFISDHGNNMGSFYQLFNCDDFFTEKPLGMFFLLLPKDDDYITDSMKKELKNNQNALISPFEIYHTLLEFSKYSLLKEAYLNYKENINQSIIVRDNDFENKLGAENPMLNYEFNKLSVSIFSAIDRKRDCSTYYEYLTDEYCRCSNSDDQK